MRSKSIKRSPRGFVQYSTRLLSVFNLVRGDLEPAKRPSARLSLPFLSKLSWYKNAHLELSTNGHPTLELFQKWHRFYRYIAIWLCIYLRCVHGLTTTADRIRASLSWQDYHTGGTCRRGWLHYFSAWFGTDLRANICTLARDPPDLSALLLSWNESWSGWFGRIWVSGGWGGLGAPLKLGLQLL